jgi:hypothetical protein
MTHKLTGNIFPMLPDKDKKRFSIFGRDEILDKNFGLQGLPLLRQD